VTSSPGLTGHSDERRTALAVVATGTGVSAGRPLDRVSGYPALLPLVVIRCADWVAPVRERAAAAGRGTRRGQASPGTADPAVRPPCRGVSPSACWTRPLRGHPATVHPPPHQPRPHRRPLRLPPRRRGEPPLPRELAPRSRPGHRRRRTEPVRGGRAGRRGEERGTTTRCRTAARCAESACPGDRGHCAAGGGAAGEGRGVSRRSGRGRAGLRSVCSYGSTGVTRWRLPGVELAAEPVPGP